MKKVYINPEISIVKINTISMLAGSLDIEQKSGDGDVLESPSEVLSNQFQGGFVWEDEK